MLTVRRSFSLGVVLGLLDLHGVRLDRVASLRPIVGIGRGCCVDVDCFGWFGRLVRGVLVDHRAGRGGRAGPRRRRLRRLGRFGVDLGLVVLVFRVRDVDGFGWLGRLGGFVGCVGHRAGRGGGVRPRRHGFGHLAGLVRRRLHRRLRFGPRLARVPLDGHADVLVALPAVVATQAEQRLDGVEQAHYTPAPTSSAAVSASQVRVMPRSTPARI